MNAQPANVHQQITDFVRLESSTETCVVHPSNASEALQLVRLHRATLIY